MDNPAEQQRLDVDVAVIGGGPAGLSAALTLARARRRVVVIDSRTPRNAPARAAHGLLGLEGIAPIELLDRGRREVTDYGGRIVDAGVDGARIIPGDGFGIDVGDGSSVRARQVLVATGVRDEFPAIAGVEQRWGRDVVHCPYCHGWEVRDRRIGLIATGPWSAMQALLFHQWTDQMWFFPNGHEFPPDQLGQLAAVGVTVVDGAVVAVDVADDRLSAVRLHDGLCVALDVVALPTLTRSRLAGLDDLQLATEQNSAGTSLTVDSAGRTSTPGVWAAGNVVNPAMQVSESAAHGARVAMTINTELVFADARTADARTAVTRTRPSPNPSAGR